jgi:polysaccharide export outer membrane protein
MTETNFHSARNGLYESAIRCVQIIGLICFSMLSVPSALLAQDEVSSGANLLPRSMDMLDDSYRFKVGDQVIYRVVEDQDAVVKRIVMDTGEVTLPYLGKVKVLGLTPKEVSYKLKPMLEKEYYKNATVLLALDTERKFRGKVYIFGAVSQPGSIQIPTDEVLTVSKALLKVGGFAPSADRTTVRIERKTTEGKKTVVVNMAEVIDQGDTEQDITVEPNDFIVIANQSSRGRVFITGEVMRPGPIPIPTEAPLMASEAILSAGGFQEFADKGKVRIIRKTGDEPGDTQELFVNVAAVLEKGEMEEDMELQPDDRVVVRARWINF